MAQREIVVGNIGTDDPLEWDWKQAEKERLGPDGVDETEMIFAGLFGPTLKSVKIGNMQLQPTEEASSSLDVGKVKPNLVSKLRYDVSDWVLTRTGARKPINPRDRENLRDFVAKSVLYGICSQSEADLLRQVIDNPALRQDVRQSLLTSWGIPHGPHRT